MRIAFRNTPFDAAQRAGLDELAHAHGCETHWCGEGVPTAEELSGCEVLMGYFPPGLLRELPNLRWLQVPSAGVERYCGDVYASDDVVLTNCSGIFGTDIAEYAVCAILMLMRHMKGYVLQSERHEWKALGPARSVFGSTAAVVGCGDIGRNVACRLKALGASCVRGICRGDGPRPGFDETYPVDEFAAALAGADIVVASLPITDATRGLIGAEWFEAMGEGSVFVNVGRGATVDQAALASALAGHGIGGAALDVFEAEPLPADDALWDMGNVIVTPHVAGWDDDLVNVQAMFGLFADNLTRYLEGRELTHVVDRGRGY